MSARDKRYLPHRIVVEIDNLHTGIGADKSVLPAIGRDVAPASGVACLLRCCAVRDVEMIDERDAVWLRVSQWENKQRLNQNYLRGASESRFELMERRTHHRPLP